MNQFELTKAIMQNLKDLDLKPSEQLVLLHIAQYDFVKQKTIIEKSGLGRSTVIEAYKVLKAKGILNEKSKICTSRFKIWTLESPKSGPPCYKNNNKNNNKVLNFGINYKSAAETLKEIELNKINSVPPTSDFLALKSKLGIR
jgi:hypothetical protein